MSTATLRFYKTTLANNSTKSERRIRDMKRRLRTKMSRRRFKQQMHTTLQRLHLV